jgi:hypothetical protein
LVPGGVDGGKRCGGWSQRAATAGQALDFGARAAGPGPEVGSGAAPNETKVETRSECQKGVKWQDAACGRCGRPPTDSYRLSASPKLKRKAISIIFIPVYLMGRKFYLYPYL